MSEKKSLALYELKAEYVAALEHFVATGEGEEFTNWLQENVREKALRVAEYFRNRELLVEQIKLAEKQMSDRRKREERDIEWLKGYLKRNMEACEISRIECPHFRLSIRKNPHKVYVDDTSRLPDELVEVTLKMTRLEYQVIKDWLASDKKPISERPKLAEIKKRIQAGEKIDGAVLGQDTRLVVD